MEIRKVRIKTIDYDRDKYLIKYKFPEYRIFEKPTSARCACGKKVKTSNLYRGEMGELIWENVAICNKCCYGL